MKNFGEIFRVNLCRSREDLFEACQGLPDPHHIFMLQTIGEDIASTEAVISKIDMRIKELLSPYDNVLELLKQVPGLNTKSVEDLVAEIGLDMSVFPNEKHLASWVGISPGNNESAGKKKAAE
jgi:transposase